MANNLPDFIVRKLYVKDSLKKQESGIVFTLNNSFAPVVIQAFSLRLDDHLVDDSLVSLTPENHPTRFGDSISLQSPFPFPLNLPIVVHVNQVALPLKSITLQVSTRDAGEVVLNIRLNPTSIRGQSGSSFHLPAWLVPALQARVEISAAEVLGEIHPFIYGQFIEHLERCIYGGIWTDDGLAPRADVYKLVDALKMPVVRYPGGNFASGYHWEDGIGPLDLRPQRFDAAWSASESNRVGTEEYLAWMRRLGSEPFLVVNDGSGTPEEAARWVAYCNERIGTQALRRAANGHPEPHNVKIWGVGNEAWGQWQIGATSAQGYAERLCKYVIAMRAVDPSIRVVAVGNTIYSDRPDDPGRIWNEIILREAAALIDDLSFHLYQPGQEGWQESYDIERLHRSVCAAPLEAERMIVRMGNQIAQISPNKKIGVVFDEWNLWLTPPPQAGSMHQVNYTMRDALYCAGMLNAFQRQCEILTMANLAQLVNVLPLIVTDALRAYPTAMYWPFWMFTRMQPLALKIQSSSPHFDADAIGVNMPAQKNVPYLDISATRSADGEKLTLSLINRHPRRKMKVEIALSGFSRLYPSKAWMLSAETPLAVNSFELPGTVSARSIALPEMRAGSLKIFLPASSVMVLTLDANKQP